MSRFLRLAGIKREKIFGYSVFAIGGGSILFPLISQGWCLDRYASIFQRYRNGFPIQSDKKASDMLQSVADDLFLPIKKPEVKIINVIGFEYMHFGTLQLSDGVYIGIPVSFEYNSADDINKGDVLVNEKAVPWFSEAGRSLEESLILSDSAKKFAIAYNLCLSNTFLIYFKMLGPFFSTCAFVFLNDRLYDRLQLHSRTRGFIGVFYIFLVSFAIGITFIFKDLGTQLSENIATEKACEGGLEYIYGGLEFVNKIIQRNKALREIMSNGSSNYTTEGEEIYWFRQKHLLLSRMKEIINEKLRLKLAEEKPIELK